MIKSTFQRCNTWRYCMYWFFDPAPAMPLFLSCRCRKASPANETSTILWARLRHTLTWIYWNRSFDVCTMYVSVKWSKWFVCTRFYRSIQFPSHQNQRKIELYPGLSFSLLFVFFLLFPQRKKEERILNLMWHWGLYECMRTFQHIFSLSYPVFFLLLPFSKHPKL